MAYITLVGPFACVGSNMFHEAIFSGESFVANITLVGTFSRVGSVVAGEQTLTLELPPTHITEGPPFNIAVVVVFHDST